MTQDSIHSFFKNYASKAWSDSVFVSEKSLVMNFAFYLKELFPRAIFRFEVPHRIQFLTQKEADLKFPKFSYIDLIVEFNGRRYGFEFKYQTAKLVVNEIHEGFQLKDQNARDVLRFGFRKDIYRLEQLKQSEKIDFGFAVLLTNDPSLIDTDCEKFTNDYAYRFGNNQSIKGGEVFWGDINATPKWTNQKAFNISLKIKNEGYIFTWHDYIQQSDLRNGKFEYAVIKV